MVAGWACTISACGVGFDAGDGVRNAVTADALERVTVGVEAPPKTLGALYDRLVREGAYLPFATDAATFETWMHTPHRDWNQGAFIEYSFDIEGTDEAVLQYYRPSDGWLAERGISARDWQLRSWASRLRVLQLHESHDPWGHLVKYPDAPAALADELGSEPGRGMWEVRVRGSVATLAELYALTVQMIETIHPLHLHFHTSFALQRRPSPAVITPLIDFFLQANDYVWLRRLAERTSHPFSVFTGHPVVSYGRAETKFARDLIDIKYGSEVALRGAARAVFGEFDLGSIYGDDRAGYELRGLYDPVQAIAFLIQTTGFLQDPTALIRFGHAGQPYTIRDAHALQRLSPDMALDLMTSEFGDHDVLQFLNASSWHVAQDTLLVNAPTLVKGRLLTPYLDWEERLPFLVEFSRLDALEEQVHQAREQYTRTIRALIPRYGDATRCAPSSKANGNGASMQQLGVALTEALYAWGEQSGLYAVH
jgi:hypothetical protein